MRAFYSSMNIIYVKKCVANCRCLFLYMPILTSLLIFYFFLIAVHKLSTPSYSRDSTSQVPSGINCAIPLFSAYFSPKILALQAQQLLPAPPSGPHLNGNKPFFPETSQGRGWGDGGGAGLSACSAAGALSLDSELQLPKPNYQYPQLWLKNCSN